jgi:hypothetical protein
VKWDKEIENIVINKKVYEENELDFVPVSEMVKGLFPVIQEEVKEEVKEKVADKTEGNTDKSEDKTNENKQAEKTESVKNN